MNLNITFNYVILAAVLCLLELTYEGFKYRGLSRLSGLVESVFLLIVIPSTILWFLQIDSPFESFALDRPGNWWKILVGVLLFRFGCFDTLINLVMKQKWYYIGTTKMYDRTIRKILDKTRVSIGLFRFIQLCCFIAGFLILLYGNTDRILN